MLNYYKKSDTYSKEEIAELIGNINKLTSEIVESLPTENISTSTIYLIKDGKALKALRGTITKEQLIEALKEIGIE